MLWVRWGDVCLLQIYKTFTPWLLFSRCLWLGCDFWGSWSWERLVMLGTGFSCCIVPRQLVHGLSDLLLAPKIWTLLLILGKSMLLVLIVRIGLLVLELLRQILARCCPDFLRVIVVNRWLIYLAWGLASWCCSWTLIVLWNWIIRLCCWADNLLETRVIPCLLLVWCP